MYKNTYTELTSFIKCIESYAIANNELLKDVPIEIKYPINKITRVLLGLAFLGKTIEDGLLEFRSNRFFLDAVGVKIYPTNDEIFKEFKTTSKNNSIGDIDSSGKLNINKLEKSLSRIKEECISKDLPLIFSNMDFPLITDKELKYLDENGYLIIPNAIPHDLCDELQNRVNHLAKWEGSSSKGGYIYGSGKMQRIYHLLSKDQLFRDLVLHPLAHIIMSHLFHRNTYHDKYYLTSFHANIIKTGGEAQIWHIDSNVPEPIPPWIIRANSNFITQDYSYENGATQLIPNSHLWLRKPNKYEAEVIDDKTILTLEAPKGSIVFWVGTLWHRSGVNSSNNNRTALLATYAASHLREMCMEENPYLSMNTNVISELGNNLKRLIGWNHGSKDY